MSGGVNTEYIKSARNLLTEGVCMAVACFSHVLKRLQLFCLCSFLIVALTGIAYADGEKPAPAASNMLGRCSASLSEDEIAFLKPIDVLLFNDEYLAQGWDLIRADHTELRSVLQEAMNEITKGNEWITVGPLWIPEGKQSFRPQTEKLAKPNVALVTFTISARKVQNAAPGDVMLGAMTVRVVSNSGKHELSAPNVAIPFLISSSKNETLQHIKDAAILIAGHLPSFMRCARKIEPYSCSKQSYYDEENVDASNL